MGGRLERKFANFILTMHSTYPSTIGYNPLHPLAILWLKFLRFSKSVIEQILVSICYIQMSRSVICLKGFVVFQFRSSMCFNWLDVEE